MERDVTVAVAGATGAVGKEVISALDAAPWRPRRLMPLASEATSAPFVSWGDDQVAVDDLGHAALADAELVIVALPADHAKTTVQAALAAGSTVVDLSASQFDDLAVPLVLPWLNPSALQVPRARDVVAVPSPGGAVIGTVLGLLAREGWRGDAQATVMVPASAWGRGGIEELSKQVVALFNSATPPRKVFEQGLAFDLIPEVGLAGSTGWTGGELRVMTEVARLSGARCDVTMVAVPVFSGLGMTLRVGVDAQWGVERVAEVLTEAGLEVFAGPGNRKMPRPRRVDGSSQIHVARIRASVGGDAIHLWCTVDNLRLTAAAAVGVAGLLLQREAQ